MKKVSPLLQQQLEEISLGDLDGVHCPTFFGMGISPSEQHNLLDLLENTKLVLHGHMMRCEASHPMSLSIT